MIIDDTNRSYKSIQKYRGKEKLLSDQTYCTSCERNKYAVVIWSPDSKQEIPHIHIIDNKTFGNEVNAAYSLIDGLPVEKHGSVINDSVNNLVLSIVNRMLKNKFDFVIRFWNSENKKFRIKKFPIFKNRKV